MKIKLMTLLITAVSISLISGCANTINGVREDVSKPFKWVGSVGDKIAPCKTEECKKDE